MKSSGLQGASTLIYTGPCRLLGVSLTADEDVTLTIRVEDNITAVGTNVVAFGRATGGNVHENVEGGGCNFVIKFSRDDNMFCDNGLYATISATSGDYIIYFEPL